MKDNLFELLLSLFEQSLTQIHESYESKDSESESIAAEEEIQPGEQDLLYIKPPQDQSMRIFMPEEQLKLTKASYQFLMRMKQWSILDNRVFELIMNQLQFSESRIVTVQEVKWTIRSLLATSLNAEQLSFLDLVLYQTEDGHQLH